MPPPASLARVTGVAELRTRPGVSDLMVHMPFATIYLSCGPTGQQGGCLNVLRARDLRDGDAVAVDYFTFRTVYGHDQLVVAGVTRDGVALLTPSERARRMARDLQRVFDQALLNALMAAGLAAFLFVTYMLAREDLPDRRPA